MKKIYDINWNAFRAKFNEKEEHSFERLSYLLFCSEHKQRIGIFRYKNQTGIETEPIKIYTLINFQMVLFPIWKSFYKNMFLLTFKKSRSNQRVEKIL